MKTHSPEGRLNLNGKLQFRTGQAAADVHIFQIRSYIADIMILQLVFQNWQKNGPERMN